MILASVTAILAGIALGYFLGLRHQAHDEVIPDKPRTYDEDSLHRTRWELKKNSQDMTFIRSSRMTDVEQETVHNVRMSDILQQISDPSERALRSADRVVIDAIKVNRKTGLVTHAILRPDSDARKVVPILRKCGLKITVGPQDVV